MKSWFAIKAKSEDMTEVMIYDEIGLYGMSAKMFVEQLNAIKSKTINLRVNSPGGSIVDGIAIYNAIKRHDSEINGFVDGLAASMASVIVLGCNKVSIAKNALMMIHNGWSVAVGDPADMRKEADVLDKMCNSMAEIYAEETGQAVDVVKKAMDEETWFDAGEAKEFGLVDDIDDEDEEDEESARLVVTHALAVRAKKNKMPNRILAMAASLKPIKKDSEMLTPYVRDGKTFVKIGEVEHEISAQAPAAPATATAVATTVSTVSIDVNKAVADAIAQERQYRADFDTAVATAGISGKALDEFKKFYGRPIEDVKYLASHAISVRTQPVGEGSGSGGESNEESKVEAAATKRFAENRTIRQLFGVMTDDASSPVYKAAMVRYIAREKQAEKDGMKPLSDAEIDAKYGKNRK